jgi:hypothetical protein
MRWTSGGFRGYCRAGSRRGVCGAVASPCFGSYLALQSIDPHTGLEHWDFEKMGGWGSGRRRKPGHRLVESCPVLDIHHLLARGCLNPGWVGTCSEVSGDAAIVLRAGVGQLYISWRPVLQRLYLARQGKSETGSGPTSGDEETAGRTEVISIFRVTYRSGARRLYFLGPGAGCGRRAFKLYLVRRRFLCRHCSGLVYASKSEQPWRQAFRRANKLRQRLGVTGRGAPEKPKDMPVSVYARLLDAMLRAEIQAAEASTARLQQLAAWAEGRHKLPFTLD